MTLSGRSCKRKGASAEREFLNLLTQALHLPETLARNLEQTRSGGADCVHLQGLAIEIKRQEKLNLTAWWHQAKAQAEKLGAVPVLAYRQSRKPWVVVVPLAWAIAGEDWGDHTAQISFDTFTELVNRRIDTHLHRQIDS